MFAEQVSNNSFIDFAEEFGVSAPIISDRSFESTFSALFYPRGKRIVVSTNQSFEAGDDVAVLYLIRGKNSKDCMENKWSGDSVEPLPDVNKFLEQRKVHIKIFLGKTKDVCVAFVDPVFTGTVHLLQALTPRLFPRIFEENPITELEKDLLVALSKKDGFILYNETISKMCDQYDFRQKKIDKYLTGFEINFEEQVIKNKEENIRQLERTIERYLEEIVLYRTSVREAQAELMGYRLMAKDKDTNGVRDFFTSNKDLELQEVVDSNVVYCVKKHLEHWDESRMETYIENERSLFYEVDSHAKIKSVADRRKLLEAIFIDRVLKIRTIASFVLRTGERIELKQYDEFPTISSYLTHPHIVAHNCLGDAIEVIHECLMNGNYASAIGQSIYATSQLTASDDPVMRWLTRKLFEDTKVRFIELPDGTCVTPAKAINWLKEQNGGADE